MSEFFVLFYLGILPTVGYIVFLWIIFKKENSAPAFLLTIFIQQLVFWLIMCGLYFMPLSGDASIIGAIMFILYIIYGEIILLGGFIASLILLMFFKKALNYVIVIYYLTLLIFALLITLKTMDILDISINEDVMLVFQISFSLSVPIIMLLIQKKITGNNKTTI